jgi:hypothetical protein
VFREHKRREKGMRDMSQAVRYQITSDKNAILIELDELNCKIKEGHLKQFNLKRDKERIIKEILALQRKTGKLYLFQHPKDEKSPKSPHKPSKDEKMEHLQDKFANIQEQNQPQSDANIDCYE